MADPKRRPTDPVPGTKAPVRTRATNDAFRVGEKQAPAVTPRGSFEPGRMGADREKTITSIVDSASRGETPRPFKDGGLVSKTREALPKKHLKGKCC
jgi:hypothetical protein